MRHLGEDELGAICSGWNPNDDWFLLSLGIKVFGELFSQVACLDTDNVVFGRVVVAGSPVHGPAGILLANRSGIAAYLTFADKAKEFPQPRRAVKRLARKYSLQQFAEGPSRLAVLRSAVIMAVLPVPLLPARLPPAPQEKSRTGAATGGVLVHSLVRSAAAPP